MKCDSCGYVFKLDGTEDCISTINFFDVPIHFCSEECYAIYVGIDLESKEED
jgi:rubredoxin